MGWPIIPRPMKAIFCGIRVLLVGRPSTNRTILKLAEIQPQSHVTNIIIRKTRIQCIPKRAEKMVGIAHGEVLRRVKATVDGARNCLAVSDGPAGGAVAVAAVGSGAQHDLLLPCNALCGV